jgi:hypothetical protein
VLRPLGYAVAGAAIATPLTRPIVPLRGIFGLVERALHATSLAWLLVAMIDMLGR